MQTLLRSLQDHDLGHLRIVAELWKVDLLASQPREAASELAEAMLAPEALAEMLDSLPDETRHALSALQTHSGRLAWSDMERRFGLLREMGPGRRDREKPHRGMTSVTEALWYRGLVARAFADTPTGPQEFAFIPDDLARRLAPPAASSQTLGEPAASPAFVMPADTTAVDDAVTLLASLRRTPLRQSPPPHSWFMSHGSFLHRPDSARLLIHLLTESRVLSPRPLQPHADAVRAFLEAPRNLRLAHLASAWEASAGWNDLAQLPDLRPADGWPNDPLASRRSALALLERVPVDQWWGIESFVSAVQREEAGFLRPGGNFSSWYLRHTEGDGFLTGIEHWGTIDGAYLRYMICGPLHWLGRLDLGGEEAGDRPLAFRRVAHARDADPSTQPATITSDGLLHVPRQTPCSLRYQLARLGAWRPVEHDAYVYRLNAASLHAAQEQGLQPGQMMSLLEAATAGRLPDHLRRAIERGTQRGLEGRLESRLVLSVPDRRVMEELQGARTTARLLGERLGPTVVVVAKADWPRLRVAAARLGILLEGPEEG
jgi:hypothetical protein